MLPAAGKAAGRRLIKLSSVASKLTTESAKDMIKAMIAGERDPRTLAALARTRMKAKHDDLVEALAGMFDDHHGELAQLLLDQAAFCDTRIAQLTARITAAVAAMPAAWGVDADGTTGPDAGTGPDAAALPAVARLAEIPGISPALARSIIAETGLDMSRFPTAAHLVSWAGLCPRARQSGPRTRAGKKNQGDSWLRGHLGQAATGAARTTTFLGERYGRIARRRGKAKAQVAVARSILVIIWHLLSDPAARYTDLGAGYYQTRTRHRPQDQQPHPPDPGPRPRRHHRPRPPEPPTAPTRPDHRTRPGSATARPLRFRYFPVSP